MFNNIHCFFKIFGLGVEEEILLNTTFLETLLNILTVFIYSKYSPIFFFPILGGGENCFLHG